VKQTGVSAKRLVGLEDLSGDEYTVISQEINAILQSTPYPLNLSDNIARRVTDYIIASDRLPECIINLFNGRSVEIKTDVYIDNQKLSFPSTEKVVMNVLPLGDVRGIFADKGNCPIVSVVTYTCLRDELVLNVNISQKYLDRVIKKGCGLHILSQILIYELLRHIAGLCPVEALLRISEYNSFQTTTDVLSDLTRDTLESIADAGAFSTLQLLVDSAIFFKNEIENRYNKRLCEEDITHACRLIERISKEARLLMDLYNLQDYATGSPLKITPGDILFQQFRTEVMISDFPCFYTPPYLVDRLSALLEDSGYTESTQSKVRVIRNIVAYKPSNADEDKKGLIDKVKHWVDLFLDFNEKNTVSLGLLKAGIMELEDILRLISLIKAMINLHSKICAKNPGEYNELLDKIISKHHDNIDLSEQLNRFINQIHQDVLKNVFGLFTGWKTFVGEVNAVSNKAVGVTVDDEGTIEFFPADKVNIIDYSGDFETGESVPARTIIETYLSTNIHLRDNCYIDCISHTNKAWFFVDLGVHGANIFVDLDPNKRSITVSYAEGGVEDGNMARLRFLVDTLQTLGFEVTKSDVTFKATIDEQTVGLLDADVLIDKAIWTIQAFASVADFDQEIEDGRISSIALRYHKNRIDSSGTGFPLYKITRGVGELKRLSRQVDELNVGIISILNQELLKMGSYPIPEDELGAKAIDHKFNRYVNNLITTGRFISNKSNPIFPNPGYSQPPPASYLKQVDNKDYLAEIADIVNVLDKSVGSKLVDVVDDKKVTASAVDVLGGKLTFYAVRDNDTGRAIHAVAVDGECLRKVSSTDNVIRDPRRVRHILNANGYTFEGVVQREVSPIPAGFFVRGLVVLAIKSCPGIATGVLRKNRPEDVPSSFSNAIFSDTILTPLEVGRLREASGFITTNDSVLSHAQLTARTFGKPGVIIQGARWTDEDSFPVFVLPLDNKEVVVREGQVVTVDAIRGMVNIVGGSDNPVEDCRDLIKEIFTLLVEIDNGMDLSQRLVRLKDIIIHTKDVEILKFIIQELFITNTVRHSRDKLKILTIMLKNCRGSLQSEVLKYLKEIVLSYRQKLQNDINKAKQRLVTTRDLNEAIFVRNKLHSQIQTLKGMERLICQRLNMAVFDYDPDVEEIQGLYEKKVHDFEADIARELKSFERSLDNLIPGDIGQIVRTVEMMSLLPAYTADKTEEIKKTKSKMEQIVRVFKTRFRRSRHRCIVDLEDTSRVISPYVGNKAAYLGDLIGAPIEATVTPGFILTRFGVKEIIERNKSEINKINRCCKANRDMRDRCLKDVWDIASGLVYPDHIKQEISRAYHGMERSLDVEEKVGEFYRLAGLANFDREKIIKATLALRGMKELPDLTLGQAISLMDIDLVDKQAILDVYSKQGGVFVVVRSSSIMEDTREDMMAGRFKSYPYIRSEKLLFKFILKCLAYYWVEMGGVTDTQPVFIHRQVEADVSMVINSINTVEERWDEVIINSARGAGAGLVSGKVDSDLYFIDAPALFVKRVIKSTKRRKCVFDEKKGYGTRFIPIDDKNEQTTPSLSEQDAVKIAKLARRIHEFFHYPVDIEAIKRGKKIYVVQVRPIVLPFRGIN